MGTVDSYGQPPVPWYSTDSGIWWAQVAQWIPLDSHLSHGTIQTVEYGGLRWGSEFPWTATCPMVQYGPWNMWAQVGQWIPLDSHLSHAQPPVPWYSTDSGIWWAQVGQWIPMDSHLSHGTVRTVEYGGLRWGSGFPWTATCPMA